MHRTVTFALAALALLDAEGCLGPQVLGITPVERTSGVWTECEDAMLHGISGDPCTFARSCGGAVVGVPTTSAFCRANDALVVDTAERFDTELLDRPRVRADGCLEQTTLGSTTRLCVVDEMLSLATDGPSFGFDATDACARLVDSPLGGSCTGATICVFGDVHDISSVAGPTPTLRPGVLGWCYGGRMRTAASLVTMPCAPTEIGGFVSCAWSGV